MQKMVISAAAKLQRICRASSKLRSLQKPPLRMRVCVRPQWRSLTTAFAIYRTAPASARAAHGRSRFISKEAEDALNVHINAEYNAHYTYLSMANHFAKTDIALHGFAQYFYGQSEEERIHAKQMIDYLLKRGGTVSLGTIEACSNEHLTPLTAFEKSLHMEEDIYDKLIALHKIASETNDPNLSDFLEGTFLMEQVTALKTVSDHVTNVRRICSTDLGVFLYDKQLSGKLNASEVLNGPEAA